MSISISTDLQVSVEELITQVQNNFKYLADCYRDPGHDILLVDKVNNLQTQTELKLTQIENKHTNEVACLREDIIEENENQLFTQQQLINDQKEIIDNQQVFINEVNEKNSNIQCDLDEYHT